MAYLNQSIFPLYLFFVLANVQVALASIQMPPASNGSKQAIPTSCKIRDGRPWQVFVAFEGYAPRESWSEEAVAASVQRTKFMESFYVLYEHQSPKGKYLLVATTLDLLPVGWVRQDITVHEEALMTNATKVHRKAMLITRAENGDKVGKQIPLLDSPRKRGQPIGDSYQLFNVFFIYGQSNPEEYDLADEVYVLLGNAQYFQVKDVTANDSLRSKAMEVVKGWVPLSRIAPWNTREAVEWDQPSTRDSAPKRRTVPGQVQSDVLTAKAVIEARSYSGSEPLFKEELDDHGESISLKPKSMRYPLLEMKSTELDLGANGVFPANSEGNELLKIGCIGGVGNYSAQKLEQQRIQIENLGVMLSSAELLFVVDDTGTMATFFNHVAQLIRSISRSAAQSSSNVKIAVAFYNDTDEQPAGWNPVALDKRCFPLTDLKDNVGETIATVVRNHPAVGGGDSPELVFRGIKEAIAAANFSPYARKLVYLIGDYPDKDDDPSTTTDEQKVARKFFMSGQTEFPIEFYAIQVCDPERDDFTRKFRQQSQDIVNIVNQTGKQHCDRLLAEYTSTDSKQVLALMEARYRDIAAKQSEIRAKMDELRAGRFGTQLGPEYIRILGDAGIDVEELRKIEGAQLFREGYVWRFSPGTHIPQVRMRLMLDRATIEDVIELISKLDDKRSTLISEKTRMEDVLLKLVEAATNEQPDATQSFEEQVYKRAGLKSPSALLRTPIGNKVPSRLAQSELVDIGHRLDLLRDILAGIEQTWEKRLVTKPDVNNPGKTIEVPEYFAVGSARSVDRHFTLPGSNVHWYWIDSLEEVP